MKKIVFLIYTSILLSYILTGCLQEVSKPNPTFKIPSLPHDLSYIPFDSELDDPDFVVCDSTEIVSGRNRLQYYGGSQKLKNDFISKHIFVPVYQSFTGFVVVRFIVNCKGQSGRYRAEALNIDFTSANAPGDLVLSSLNLIKQLDDWEKDAVEAVKRSIQNSSI